MSRATRTATEPEPTWEVAHLFPLQGGWTEDEYFALDGNYFVEFSCGYLDVLPRPTTWHQLLVGYLAVHLMAFAEERQLGTALIGPIPMRLWPGEFREADVIFTAREHASRMGEKLWQGADLVMEVVIGREKDRRRDLHSKRHDYARAGIREYWIVDTKEVRITVLRLGGKRYVVHGEFGFTKGPMASSHLLQGFSIDVYEAFGPQMAAKIGRKKKRRSKK